MPMKTSTGKKQGKPDLALVIGMGPKKGTADDEGPMEHEGEKPEEEGAEHEAMAALGDAIHAKDWGAAKEAFRMMHKLCASAGDDDMGEDGGDEEE